MRVLHVSSVGMNARGGTEQAIRLLCRHLGATGVENLLWSPYGGGAVLDELVAEAVLTDSTSSLNPRELARFVAHHRIDIALLHSGAQNPLYAAPPARVIAEMSPLPFIEVMHRAMPSWAAPHRIDRIVAVSRCVAALQEPGVTAKVRTIYNGLEPALLAAAPPDKHRARESLGLPQSALVAGFLGRLTEEKGPQDLLDAAASVSRTVPDACFVFGGEGPLRGALQQRAAAAHPAAVRFPGEISGERRAEFYASLDLLVLPTRTESFGFVAVEAMAAGLPVVAYRVGALPEILGSFGASNVLVDANDVPALAAKIAHLLTHPEERTAIGSNNRRAALHFTIEATAKAYRSLFDEVLGDTTGRSEWLPTAGAYRFCGNMALLVNDRSCAESCFRSAVALDPAVGGEIEADFRRFIEFAQRLQNAG